MLPIYVNRSSVSCKMMLSFAEKYPKRNICGQQNNENSMYKFVEDFSREMTNNTFPSIGKTVSNLKTPKVSEGILETMDVVQPKRNNLSLNNGPRKRPSSCVKEDMLDSKSNKNGNVTLLPLIGSSKATPKPQPTTTRIKTERVASKPTLNDKEKLQADPFRSLTLISGNVEFAVKMHKLNEHLNLLYEIYGKILRICAGKFPCEQVILLRSETGPVLQAVFYEIDTKLNRISVGNDVRCVGKFKGSSRIQLFKITPLDCPPSEESLIRLQNLCNFALNKMKGNYK